MKAVFQADRWCSLRRPTIVRVVEIKLSRKTVRGPIYQRPGCDAHGCRAVGAAKRQQGDRKTRPQNFRCHRLSARINHLDAHLIGRCCGSARKVIDDVVGLGGKRVHISVVEDQNAPIVGQNWAVDERGIRNRGKTQRQEQGHNQNPKARAVREAVGNHNQETRGIDRPRLFKERIVDR